MKKLAEFRLEEMEKFHNYNRLIVLKYTKTLFRFFFTNKIGSNGIILMDPTSFKTIAKILKILDLDNPVELYTINQVKGLEFDNVLVLDIDKSKYIEDYSNLEDNENNEVAKQLYVAITRATTNLALTYQNYDMNFYLGE